MGLQYASVWVPVTAEMLADAMPLNALIEYRLTQSQPLTLRERLTGWRTFTARSGYVLTFRVGWRLALYWVGHPIENWRRLHPPPSEPDEDD